MEYLFIFLLQTFGVFFNVIQNIIKIGDDNKSFTRKQVLSQFFKTDWDTLCASGGILALHELIHFMLEWYGYAVPKDLTILLTYYGLTIFLGWGGQRALYKIFGKTEQVINNKIDNFK